MRTNIDIEDVLMAQALATTGLPTKRAAVEEGLRLLVKLKRQEAVRGLRGTIDWQGDLDESRAARSSD